MRPVAKTFITQWDKMARPSKYDPKYCELLYEHLAEGHSFRSFGGRIRVCEDTLYEWAKVHEEFSEAKKEGRLAGLFQYEKDVMSMYKGEFDGGNATALVWYGKNMHKWTDKQEIEVGGSLEVIIDKDDSNL
jgi:hypothetical protein